MACRANGRSQVCRSADVGLVPWLWVAVSSAGQVSRVAGRWSLRGLTVQRALPAPRGWLVPRVTPSPRRWSVHRVRASLRRRSGQGTGSSPRGREVPRAESALRGWHAARRVGSPLRERQGRMTQQPLRGHAVSTAIHPFGGGWLTEPGRPDLLAAPSEFPAMGNPREHVARVRRRKSRDGCLRVGEARQEAAGSGRGRLTGQTPRGLLAVLTQRYPAAPPPRSSPSGG